MYALFAAILIICILFLPFRAEIAVKGRQISVKVFLADLPVGKFSPKRKNKNSESTSPADNVKEAEESTLTLCEKIKYFRDVFKIAVKLMKKYVTVDNIELAIDEGTGDAATTAISAGLLWTAVYGLIAAIGNIMSINRHNVQINPVYTKAAFSLNGKCIIKSRIVYIIFIAITILKKIKAPKGKEE